VREAQGVVTDLTGGPNMLDNGHIIAANDPLHPQLLKLIRTAK
jgi:myo-inositol-1(or 4)-monophosphatase